MGPATPPGWELQPSSRPQRALLIALGFAGFLVSPYLAAYQLGYTDYVGDPSRDRELDGPGRTPGGQGVAAGGSVTCTRRHRGSGTGILVTTAARMRMAGQLSPDRSPAVPGAAGDRDAARSPKAADGLVIRTRGWQRARLWITDPGALGALLAAPITKPAADRHPRSRRGRRAAVVVTGGERRDSVAVRPISARFLSSSSA